MPDLTNNVKMLPHILPSMLPKDGQVVKVKEVKILDTYPAQSLELSFDGTPRTLVLNSDNKIARWCKVLGFVTENWVKESVLIKPKRYGKNEYIDVEKPF